MTLLPPFLCVWCIRLRTDGPTGAASDAFPDGVPVSIVENRADHRQPVRGDNGIRFEAGPGYDREVADDLLGV
ncbi:MAG: hypothetical protein OXF41_06260 [bacterium]|nr:hypothetical protein [bacterium]